MLTLGWDGEHDPMNPRNWELWRKAVVIGFVSAITFFSPLASSMFAPGIPSVMQTFNTTNESLGTFCVSVYVLVPPPLLSKLIQGLRCRSSTLGTNVGNVWSSNDF